MKITIKEKERTAVRVGQKWTQADSPKLWQVVIEYGRISKWYG